MITGRLQHPIIFKVGNIALLNSSEHYVLNAGPFDTTTPFILQVLK